MKIDKLSYQKPVGTTPQKAVKKKTKSTSILSASPDEIKPSAPQILHSEYSKDDANVSTAILFVLSGGEEREKAYLKPINFAKKIVVAFKSKRNQGLKPKELDTLAKQIVKNHQFDTDTQTYHFEKDDSLYVLQDVDEFSKDIQRILNDQQSKQVLWLISNPCFEMWLYYHYIDDEPKSLLSDMEKLTTAQRSQWLKNKLNDLVSGGINPTKALEHLQEAIDRSRRYYAEENAIPLLYATQMDKLAERVIALDSDKEIENYFIAQRRKQERWKAKIADTKSPYRALSGKKIDDLIHSLCVWDKEHPLSLPLCSKPEQKGGQTIVDNRAFVASYKIEKTYLDDTSDQIVTNTDDLFMIHIRQDVMNFYFTQLVLHDPIKTYLVDYNHIEEALLKIGVNASTHSALTTLHLSQSIIPSYHISRGFDERLYIMHNDYLPLFSWKQYEGSNPEFKEIKEGSKVYANFHQVKNYDDGYGVTVMRAGTFMLPPSGSFRMICLKLVGFDCERSDIDKLSIRDTILLQYEEGDFVLYQNIICEVEKIYNDGSISLKYIKEKITLNDIQPIPVDGVHDRPIYYDPIVAASTIIEGHPIPVHKKDDSYYMDRFKKEEWSDEKQTTWDKVNECHFRYVHEIQHWLRAETSQDGLKIQFDEELKAMSHNLD